MNILIVDDDRFVVSALEKKIDWNSLGIQKTFCAYSLSQAQKIFRQESIDLMISDIEMPRGSGLELLSWIRQEGYATVVILLTNHADFYYAQKAIALQSFEYCLKPVEFDKLQLILGKAVAKIKEDRQFSTAGVPSEEEQKHILEHFWYQLFHSSVEQNSPYDSSDLFLLISIRCFPWFLDGSRICSSLEEVPDFFMYLKSQWISCCNSYAVTPEAFLEYSSENQHYISIFRVSQEHASADSETYRPLCRHFMSALQEKYRISIRCDISDSFQSAALQTALDSLAFLSQNTMVWHSHTFTMRDLPRPSSQAPKPPLTRLEQALKAENADLSLNICRQYFSELADCHQLTTQNLKYFLVDVMQAVYTFLKEHEILVHKLFQDSAFQRLQNRSTDSLESAELYLHCLIQNAFDYIHFTDSTASVAETIRKYVDTHFQMDLNRNDLANIVYLHPDYAARVFKKETGISLNNYIIQRRIEEAKKLLQETDLAINVISDRVGYGNYSYFTKLFKKETGYTPQEFRKYL